MSLRSISMVKYRGIKNKIEVIKTGFINRDKKKLRQKSLQKIKKKKQNYQKL